jgi:hypothetical protein
MLLDETPVLLIRRFLLSTRILWEKCPLPQNSEGCHLRGNLKEGRVTVGKCEEK